MTDGDKRKLPFPAKEDLLVQKFEIRDEVEGWVRGRTTTAWCAFWMTVAGFISAVFFAPPDFYSHVLVMGVVWVLVVVLIYWLMGRKLRQAEQALASLEAFASYDKLPPGLKNRERQKMRKISFIGAVVLLNLLGCVDSAETNRDPHSPPGTPAMASFEITGIETRTVLVDQTHFNPDLDRPFLGRLPRAGDFREDASMVAVLSHRLWKDMGGSPQVIGNHILIGDVSRTVIGVMGPDFLPADWSVVWVTK